MAAPSQQDPTPIEGKAQLVRYMEEGCTPPADWRIGTEHEKFAYDPETFAPLPFDGPRGIEAILKGLTRFGWEPVEEHGKVIALKHADGASVTLEPGGQVELSGAAVGTIHQTCDELTSHLKQVREVTDELGVSMMGIGYRPKCRLEDIPWMPKGRYKIMREYMAKKGTLGHHMMLATCTVQVNLDFDTEERMVRMFRVALALQPVATAMWANSPFREGKKNGYLSFRSHVWTDTDPDRTGMLPFVFDDGFGFERYVDYMLDVPMYFVVRDGEYVDASGQSFRDFMEGKLPALPGETPTMGDWVDHMTTTFPEVRLKHFLEMRGADGGPWGRLCALPAYWVGLLYDDATLAEAEALIAGWTVEEMQEMRDAVPTSALKTPFRGGTLQDLARETLRLARQGLRARARPDSSGQDETHFLEPLVRIAETGVTPAEELIRLYDTEWGGEIDPVFSYQTY